MSLTHPAQPACPAAELEHPIFSAAPCVRCRITGIMQAADPETAPCLTAYAGDGHRPPCAVWVEEKRQITAGRQSRTGKGRTKQFLRGDGEWVTA
jgi:hypothetical protein